MYIHWWEVEYLRVYDRALDIFGFAGLDGCRRRGRRCIGLAVSRRDILERVVVPVMVDGFLIGLSMHRLSSQMIRWDCKARKKCKHRP